MNLFVWDWCCSVLDCGLKRTYLPLLCTEAHVVWCICEAWVFYHWRMIHTTLLRDSGKYFMNSVHTQVPMRQDTSWRWRSDRWIALLTFFPLTLPVAKLDPPQLGERPAVGGYMSELPNSQHTGDARKRTRCLARTTFFSSLSSLSCPHPPSFYPQDPWRLLPAPLPHTRTASLSPREVSPVGLWTSQIGPSLFFPRQLTPRRPPHAISISWPLAPSFPVLQKVLQH